MNKKTVLALADYLSQHIKFVDVEDKGEFAGVRIDGCDKSLKFTVHWLVRYRVGHLPADLDWLRSYGGNCDCEVLMNVAGRIDEILREEAAGTKRFYRSINPDDPYERLRGVATDTSILLHEIHEAWEKSGKRQQRPMLPASFDRVDTALTEAISGVNQLLQREREKEAHS